MDIKTISIETTTMYSDAVAMKLKLKITGRLLNQDGRGLGAAARGGLRPQRAWARREGCILVFTGTVWLASEAGSLCKVPQESSASCLVGSGVSVVFAGQWARVLCVTPAERP